MLDVIVIGAGPAGVVATLRAADLGAKTALITRDAFGGMAANDGPVPVRTLAHAARLMREAHQLKEYGISVKEPTLKYMQLLKRVHAVVNNVREHSAFRKQIDALGVAVYEQSGLVHFIDANTIETANGLRLQAKKFIICTGGVSRKLNVPGSEFTVTHSDAWALTSVPKSMIVIGGGATGIQVASIFNAFGSHINLFQVATRILPSEDVDVSAAVAESFRNAGIKIHEDFGEIEGFEKTPLGIKMHYIKNREKFSAEAQLAVVAIGWMANSREMQLHKIGVELNNRGYLQVNDYMQTTVPHIFAAGDITGRIQLVPKALQEGYIAASNAVRENKMVLDNSIMPIGSFTDPEYAHVGLTEAQAREHFEIATAIVKFDETTRTIIDGRTTGFCKIIVDKKSFKFLGCHIVGERAVEISQVATIIMAANMRVDDLAKIPFAFPTYTGILSRAAASITHQLNFRAI